MATAEYHELRRHQITQAVERLIAGRGFDRVTMAATAAEAGVSVGLVQHYFSSKDELLRHAYTQVTERARARVLRRTDGMAEHHESIRTVVGAGLTERLPLDETRRTEWRVSFAFAARAVDQPELAAMRNRTEAAVRARLAQGITNGKECGEVLADTDAEARATGLLAFVDGLALHCYLNPEEVPPAVAEAELNRYLDEVFPGQCGQYD